MRIERLRLAGFKSFVEPADLVIRDGLTGVVGPNGCGKSNLLEALRWTMGEAGARSMRGAGMEDVVFADMDGQEHEITRRIVNLVAGRELAELEKTAGVLRTTR